MVAPVASALLHRLAEGDADALGDLFDRYGGLVNALVLHIIPDAEAADEILQAVFLQAWRDAGSQQGKDTPPVTWLCTMACGRALARLDAQQQVEGARPRCQPRSRAEHAAAAPLEPDVC